MISDHHLKISVNLLLLFNDYTGVSVEIIYLLSVLHIGQQLTGACLAIGLA